MTRVDPSVLVVAGEASADHHAAKIVKALVARGVAPFGMGGDAMEAAGFDAVVHAREMSVMGLVEVVRHLPRVFRIFARLERAVEARRPKVALLIDLPDFNLRLARFLKAQGVYVIYYISPQLWAWREGRVRAIRERVDEMLCVLPFEEAFYRAREVPARFIGHPLVEDLAGDGETGGLRGALGVGDAPFFALLPGSRRQEGARLTAPLLDAAAHVVAAEPRAHFVIPLAGTTDPASVAAAIAARPALAGRVHVLVGRAQEALAAVDAAAVASGTATLEAALIGVPLVAVYKISRLSFAILSRLVKVSSVILANLIAGRRVVDELLQDDADPARIADYLLRFYRDPAARAHARAVRQELFTALGQRHPTAEVIDAILMALAQGGTLQ